MTSGKRELNATNAGKPYGCVIELVEVIFVGDPELINDLR